MTPTPENAAPHIPVLIDEVLSTLNAQDGDTIIDGTFGAGGYTHAILDAADTHVIALDRDPNVALHVACLRSSYGARFSFHQCRFSEMEIVADAATINGVVLDIGVSSMQLDEAERGFSFRFDGALDMRMSSEGTSAADIVNQTSEQELARMIWEYGEERASRRIARAIVNARTETPITTTLQLRDIIHRVLPPRHNQIDPATRTFQALRIAVNQELDELRDALYAAERLLAEGGRLVVVTFHSLEDRIVKRFFKDACATQHATSRHVPDTGDQPIPRFTPLTRKAITASEGEIARNPRARSAKLRAATRTAAPAWEGAHA